MIDRIRPWVLRLTGDGTPENGASLSRFHGAESRIEYKYYLPAPWRTGMLDALHPLTRPDRHGGPDGSYRVVSVYFDDPALQAYHDKVEGQFHRVKARLRLYPDAPALAGVLEFKCRAGDRQFKEKLPLTLEQRAQLLAGEFPALARAADTPPALAGFAAQAMALGWRASVWVRYRRTALFATNDAGARINLDDQLRAGRMVGDPAPWQGAGLPILSPARTILEIKSLNYIPYFMATLIDRYGLRQAAISKYVLAHQNIAVNSTLSRL